jgi:hypothetical protein
VTLLTPLDQDLARAAVIWITLPVIWITL